MIHGKKQNNQPRIPQKSSILNHGSILQKKKFMEFSIKGTLSLELIFWYMKNITFLNAIHKVKYSISTPFTFKLAD